jgi:hypothetical protein
MILISVPRRKPPVTMQESLTRALHEPYGADKFAHFDTKKFGAHPNHSNLPGLLLLATYLGSAFLYCLDLSGLAVACMQLGST